MIANVTMSARKELKEIHCMNTQKKSMLLVSPVYASVHVFVRKFCVYKYKMSLILIELASNTRSKY